jgi:hypothetical protein
MRQYISYSLTLRKLREYCTTFSEFGVPVKLVRLIKMCLNETYSKVHIGKHLSDMCPIRNGLRLGHAFLPLLFNCDIRKVQEN